MKRTTLFIIGMIAINTLLAQAPQGISHQAVIRDAGNELVTNSTIGVRVSILQGSATGDAAYVETHTPQSNANGLTTYVIGEGNAVEGQFSEIDWSDGPYFLKTEVDPDGGTDYSISGVTQFLSVPYAIYAKESAGVNELFNIVENLQNGLEFLLKNTGMEAVIDIDGNIYPTVKIGEQTWMADNLRVTRYNNGDIIPTGLSNGDWGETTEGAYAVYQHEDVSGINSKEEMVEAYGKLYNWFAVNDSRGLCPEGWRVPSDGDWTQLLDYLMDEYGYHNELTNNDINGVGNALKSCRQIGHFDSDCNTSEHPRFSFNGTHRGFDEFDFSAIGGGIRVGEDGAFESLGTHGGYWSSTFAPEWEAWARGMGHSHGSVTHFTSEMWNGFSVRCVRELD